MTLVEFLSPLKNSPHKDRILAVLYFKHRYETLNALSIEQIRQGLHRGKAKGWKRVNIADVLIKSGHYVDSPGTQGNRRLWSLTPSGVKFVQKLLSLPVAHAEIEHDVGSLETLASKNSDQQVKGYIDETIKCLQVGAIRASIVFLWVGAIRTIQIQLLTYTKAQLNLALLKHDPKARTVTSLDHFAYIKDKITILAAFELGDFDKTEKDTLEEALNLRNRCGHPGNYLPGVKKASSFIEDVVSIVFK